MLTGLKGRRIAVTQPDSGPNESMGAVKEALEAAGAAVEVLAAQAPDESWHGGKYAALVVVADGGGQRLPTPDPRLVQLVREFLVSEKPVAQAQALDGVVTLIAGGNHGGDREAVVEISGRERDLEKDRLIQRGHEDTHQVLHVPVVRQGRHRHDRRTAHRLRLPKRIALGRDQTPYCAAAAAHEPLISSTPDTVPARSTATRCPSI